MTKLINAAEKNIINLSSMTESSTDPFNLPDEEIYKEQQRNNDEFCIDYDISFKLQHIPRNNDTEIQILEDAKDYFHIPLRNESTYNSHEEYLGSWKDSCFEEREVPIALSQEKEPANMQDSPSLFRPRIEISRPAQQKSAPMIISSGTFDSKMSFATPRVHHEEKKGIKEHSTKKSCCRCKKTQCLQLYCECFGSGKYCQGCKCAECYNKPIYEYKRTYALQEIQVKNPLALHRRNRTVSTYLIDCQKPIRPQCRCSKSECLKGYCDCFKKGYECNALCSCVNCKNTSANHLIRIVHRIAGIKDTLPVNDSK